MAPQVRVNAVAPGAILWPESWQDEEQRRKIVAHTLLKREGDPLDIAKTVAFLIAVVTAVLFDLASSTLGSGAHATGSAPRVHHAAPANAGARCSGWT